MEILPWIGRVIIILLIARMVLNLLFRRGRPAARRPPPPPAERPGGTLVRDPQCGTYVLEARAVRVGNGPDALCFCSTACRDAYRQAHSSVA